MNWKIIKKHIMTGISFMVPVVVGAGLCQALGVILGGPNVKDAVGSFAYIIYKVGNLGMSTMIIPVICAAISYSIADKPGIAPGLVLYISSEQPIRVPRSRPCGGYVSALPPISLPGPSQ